MSVGELPGRWEDPTRQLTEGQGDLGRVKEEESWEGKGMGFAAAFPGPVLGSHRGDGVGEI